MTDLLIQIRALLNGSTHDLDHIERTLTDGYAHALSLEAEQWRLEKRRTEVTHGLQRGDTAKKARELAEIAAQLDSKAGDLRELRSVLSDLRRHAASVRVASLSAS
jgi:hypothetical protein